MTDRPPAWAAWGKAGPAGVHPLACHALDTAGAAEQLIGALLGPGLRDELLSAFSPLGEPKAWIATFCGLHDHGKYSAGFQSLRVDLALARLGSVARADLMLVRKRPGTGRRVDTPHGTISALYFFDLLRQWGTPTESAERIALALGGHHGYFPSLPVIRQARREVNNLGRATWSGWRDELFEAIVALRGLPPADTRTWDQLTLSVPAAVALAALTTVSDWIASDVKNFPLTDTTDLSAYAATVPERARAAVARLDLRPWQPITGFTELFPQVPKPFPVQAVVENVVRERIAPAGQAAGPMLVLVEAPTGEGKSKAALQATAMLRHHLNLAGAYIAMPTRATSNQMSCELRELNKQHGDAIDVRLVYSGAEDVSRPLPAEPDEVNEDGGGDDVDARSWFAGKRNLISVLGVGTVDQMLKGSIRSGHVFVRLSALSNKVVVIDEIHSYSLHMSTLLDRLLMWLGRLGVPVVMLSATLPERRRQELLKSWQAGLLRCPPGKLPDARPANCYPRVTVADATDLPRTYPAEVSEHNSDRAVELSRIEDHEVAERALALAARGSSVLVLHNLVRRTQATYDAVLAAADRLPARRRPDVELIHGRLSDGKRREIEARLVRDFGPKGKRPPAVVISTQVLEQGVDLDFDAMITDVAPMDKIIQRIGRVRRHRRSVSTGPTTVLLCGVADTDTGPIFPPYTDRVYARMIMLRTWALLRERTTLNLPGEVTDLVDWTYGLDHLVPCPAGWEQTWGESAAKLRKVQDAEKRNVELLYIPTPDALDCLSEMTEYPKSPTRTRESRRTR